MTSPITSTPVATAPAADLAQLAATDRRAVRTLVAAERSRQQMQARVATQTAEAEQKLRLDQERARIAREAAAARREDSARRARERDQRRAARRTARLGRMRAVVTAVAAAVPVLARRVVLVGPIVAPMAVAWVGQISFATRVMGWPLPAAVGFAAAWELSTVYMARLARTARSDGDRALLLRAGTWTLAGLAALMNYWHASSGWAPTPVAVSYGVMSLMGISLWEAYESVKHRQDARSRRRRRSRRPSLGLAYTLRYPRRAWWAWSAAIADTSITTVEDLLDAAAEHERARHRQRLRRAARRAVRRATRRGQAGPALAALAALAHTGVPATRAEITGTGAGSTSPVPAAGTDPGTGDVRVPALPGTDPGTGRGTPAGTRPVPVPAGGTRRSGTRVAAGAGTRRRRLSPVTGTGSRPPVPPGAGTARERARTFWDREREAGRVPTGAELARVAGVSPASGLGRRWARQWTAST